MPISLQPGISSFSCQPRLIDLWIYHLVIDRVVCWRPLLIFHLTSHQIGVYHLWQMTSPREGMQGCKSESCCSLSLSLSVSLKMQHRNLPEVRRNERKQAPGSSTGSHSCGLPHGFVWETSYFPSPGGLTHTFPVGCNYDPIGRRLCIRITQISPVFVSKGYYHMCLICSTMN